MNKIKILSVTIVGLMALLLVRAALGWYGAMNEMTALSALLLLTLTMAGAVAVAVVIAAKKTKK